MNKDALINSLNQTIEIQSEQLKQQSLLLEKLQLQLDQLLRTLYGKKSEKQTKPKKESGNDSPPGTGQRSRKKSSNRAKSPRIPESLPKQERHYELPEKEQVCNACNSQLSPMGKKVTEQIEYIPGHLINLRHIRHQYVCRTPGCNCIKIATMPNQPIEKGLPGPGLLAEVLTSKYQDSLPLYRQMLRFKRLGYSCSDNTLGDWVKECAFLLQPVVELMQTTLFAAKKIHTDDTVVPVLQKGKNTTRNGRLWVYLTEKAGTNPICIYQYSPTRSGKIPLRFLKEYQGYIQADAYPGYDKVYASGDKVEVACMAHARRKFNDIAKLAKGPSHAQDIVDLMKQLYRVEKNCSQMTDIERYHYRRRFAKPWLWQLKRKAKKLLKQVVPKTPFCEALNYLMNHWFALTRYLAAGYLSIDNNAAERAMRPIAIGRKNWIFAGSDAGAQRAAVIYSIIETCKMNHINTAEYLADVLMRIPNTLNKDLFKLLPFNWQPSRH